MEGLSYKQAIACSPGIVSPPTEGRRAHLGHQNTKRFLLLFGLCVLAYFPALDNGFISDDYIMLDWVERWREDVSYLFKIAPDVFRITSYSVLRFFTWAFGYTPVLLYAFVLLVHFANCVLLWKLILSLTGNTSKATMTALLFAVVQNPQEAVFWLAAMADALSGFFILAALLLWRRGHHVGSSVLYLFALFSKESSLVLLLLIPTIDYWTGRKPWFGRTHIGLMIATAVFLLVFLLTMPSHHMVSERLYEVGWHAVPVLVNSLHRLLFPWLYLGILLLLVFQREPPPREAGWGVSWMVLALLPFIFLTYQDHVPSRQEYIPSMGLAFALACLVATMRRPVMRGVFAATFIAANISYIWMVKDPQFERRAAPTRILASELSSRPPTQLLISNFPINPWMAKLTARLVDGWEPEMIEVDVLPEHCAECLQLRWNSESEQYDEIVSAKYDRN